MSRSNAPIGHSGPPTQPANAQPANAPRLPQGGEAFAQQAHAPQPPYAPQASAGQWPPATNPAAYGHAHGNAPAPAQHPSQDFYYPQQQAAPLPQADPRYAHSSYAQQAAPQQAAAQWPPQTDPRSQDPRSQTRPPAVDAARYFAQAPQGQPPTSGQPDPGRTQRQFAAQPQIAPQAAAGPINSLPPQRNYQQQGQQQTMPQAPAPQWAHDPRMGEPSLDFGHYGAQGGTGQQQQPVARRPAAVEQQAYQQQQLQQQQLQQQQANQGYAEEEEYEEEFVEEEPRRGRRGLLVVAALVGAIGLGGSMAYVYKTYGKSFASGKPPLVKAEAQPAKTKPATPGGKEFPNADRKIFGRLGEDAAQGAQTAASAPADTQADGGPRKVQTIAIAPSSPAGPTVSVPGMAIENVGPSAGARALPPIIPQQQLPPVAQKAAPVAAAPKPAPPPVVAAAPPPAAATVAAAEIVPAPRKPAPRPKANDALTSGAASSAATAASAVPAAAAAAPAAATGTNGFVAVLSSQKSRLDALKVYADIQQKFGQVLSNKPADVQEANLGDKGVFYRAVVGPPGSRDAASTLCGQLKAAGFAGCWVTAY